MPLPQWAERLRSVPRRVGEMAPLQEDLPKRIALAHEWFTPRSTGGAELVVHAIDALLCSLDRAPQLAALVDGESSRSQLVLALRPPA